MNKKRCNRCSGTGRVMGGGMIMWDCKHCDGTGKIFEEPDFEMKKDTEEYKKTKKKIKDLDPKMTEKQAEKLLDEELVKLKGKK